MRNGWTGGQYSLFRAFLGALFFAHFVRLGLGKMEALLSAGALTGKFNGRLIDLLPGIADRPPAILVIVLSAAVAALFFGAGKFDRIAAIWMWCVLVYLACCYPVIGEPSFPFAGWLLIVHCFLPRGPYGSLAAAGRADPGDNWVLPRKVFLAVWLVMAMTYTCSGYAKLMTPSWLGGTAVPDVLELARNPILRRGLQAAPEFVLKLVTWGALCLELLFAPVACFRILRPWLWAVMFLLQLGRFVVFGFGDPFPGLIVVHLFLFDPAWIRGWQPGEGEAGGRNLLFYDGHCGLCHGVVRFVLAEDRAGRIRFAPLQGKALETAIPDQERRAALPDSIILCFGEGGPSSLVLVKSDAVIRLLAILGGYWRAISVLIRLFPRPVRDLGYDLVASYRRRIFGTPPDACPLMPSAFRERFEFE